MKLGPFKKWVQGLKLETIITATICCLWVMNFTSKIVSYLIDVKNKITPFYQILPSVI